MSIKTVVLNGDRMNYDGRLDFSILSDFNFFVLNCCF